MNNTKLQVGNICRIRKGIKHNNDSQWLETNDYVTVVGTYKNHVLVERPYSGRPNKMLRECFSWNNWKRYLEVII